MSVWLDLGQTCHGLRGCDASRSSSSDTRSCASCLSAFRRKSFRFPLSSAVLLLLPLGREVFRMTAAYESTVIALCAAHKKENRHHGDYRACIYTDSHFVKYGPRKQLEPELKTHSYIANYALTSPDAPRIAGISAFVDGNTMYLVIERIKLVAPPPSDLPGRICEAVIWLLQVPAPQGHSLGPLGGGRIPHKFFKDFKAPLEFPDTVKLSAYIQKAYDVSCVQKTRNLPRPDISKDRLMCVQSDMDDSNFGVDDAGRTVLMDFGTIAWLPESFAAFTLSNEKYKPVCDSLCLADNPNTQTMCWISWFLHMTGDPTLGMGRIGTGS
uniref:Aminoglycoside phosphotransferase domain-containing protein n=1 Tax=Mycena chlorophos TaxID=658473 RepID=A0ABQ0LQQ7_MYCCL|nr:predicted protein [Mycena chlorophos]